MSATQSGIRRQVDARTGRYEICVERGALASLPALLRAHATAQRYAIVTDANVALLYGHVLLERLADDALRADLFTFPAGENSKTRETWARISDAMFDRGFGRDACVIALGGGVAGDLGGFVAATFMRGVPLVLVPTSLLAMIDASIGGKTGVDTPAGKNLVGSFHAPRLVLTDPDLLATLPDAEFRAGIAEAIKHAAIADAEHLAWLEAEATRILARERAVLDLLILRSVEIKAAFVSQDEREAGARAALNFGHTIGHAIEHLTRYAMPHGYAVAIGMVAEARLGEHEGVTAPGTVGLLERALASFGLPTAVPAGLAPESIAAATATDKKSRQARVRYALLARAGEVAGAGGAWTQAVETDRLIRSLAG
ncbi:MAG: 3-dehydroquinate synthase [Longimicrobiales bacterium]